MSGNHYYNRGKSDQLGFVASGFVYRGSLLSLLTASRLLALGCRVCGDFLHRIFGGAQNRRCTSANDSTVDDTSPVAECSVVVVQKTGDILSQVDLQAIPA